MNWDSLLVIHASFLRSVWCVWWWCLPIPDTTSKEFFSKFRVRDVIKTKNSSTICRLHYFRSNFHHFMWVFFCDIDSTLYDIPNNLSNTYFYHLNFPTGNMVPCFYQLLIFKDFLYKCACQVNLSGFISCRPRSWV